ncbi:MAG: YggS family pyridoxal phosphate-dependent enzyme, partial [Anaerovoracaceae bacterium]
MVDIKGNLKAVQEGIPEDVLLVAVTKTHTAEEMNVAIEEGVTD